MQISAINFKNLKYNQPQGQNQPAPVGMPYNNYYPQYGPRPYPGGYYNRPRPYSYNSMYPRMMPPSGYYGMMMPPPYMRFYNPYYTWYPFDNYDYISRYKDADIRRQFYNAAINKLDDDSNIDDSDKIDIPDIDEVEEKTVYQKIADKAKDVGSIIKDKIVTFYNYLKNNM
ncbi:hypothetical protein IJG72_06910 [bacterium]|nr:hypothetical protein [bacterium]